MKALAYEVANGFNVPELITADRPELCCCRSDNSRSYACRASWTSSVVITCIAHQRHWQVPLAKWLVTQPWLGHCKTPLMRRGLPAMAQSHSPMLHMKVYLHFSLHTKDAAELQEVPPLQLLSAIRVYLYMLIHCLQTLCSTSWRSA